MTVYIIPLKAFDHTAADELLLYANNTMQKGKKNVANSVLNIVLYCYQSNYDSSVIAHLYAITSPG